MFADSINEKVMEIKFSKENRSAFIEEYKPFIAASVEKFTGKYVSYGRDDELSIGLMAFDEAILHYDRTKGNFLSFAKNVIHKRLIDYYRKEKNHQNTTYISEYYTDEDDSENVYDYVVTAEEAQSKYEEQEINQLRRQELVQLKDELSAWDLKFEDIAKSSPKHGSTKKYYLDIVKFIIDRPELVKRIKTKMYLPIAEIEEGTKLPRKTIERSRNYVIAAVIILTGDYYCIREFIDWGWSK
ncbi:MAG: RNA polymerase sigma-I factor [Caulobacteraceae bacterium]